jgi:predicted kinase
MINALPFEPKLIRQAIIFIGIQASGKSTFYKDMLACHGYVHVNLDTLHTRNNENKAISECYDKDRSFVIDNTNPEKNDRARCIPDAKSHGYEVIGVFFQSILKDCIARNEKRERQVPSHAIPCIQNKLQMPEYSEGFDKIYFVRITDKGFEITDWIE